MFSELHSKFIQEDAKFLCNVTVFNSTQISSPLTSCYVSTNDQKQGSKRDVSVTFRCGSAKLPQRIFTVEGHLINLKSMVILIEQSRFLKGLLTTFQGLRLT